MTIGHSAPMKGELAHVVKCRTKCGERVSFSFSVKHKNMTNEQTDHHIQRAIRWIFLAAAVLIAYAVSGQRINYTVDANGVHIQGVDQTNPVIYDNDMIKDTPEAFYLFLKANRKEVNLVGVISSQNGHPQAGVNERQPALFQQFNEVYNSFRSMGGQNVPAPILGSSRNLNNGQTAWESSPGSDLIISEAKKASPSKLLVIFVGGQVTTVANALLKDRSIKDNIIVFHVDGWGNTQFNAIDGWACQVLIDGGVKYINWDGDNNSWYDQAGSPQYRGYLNPPIKRMEGITFTTMNNGFHNMYKSNFSHMYDAYGTIGDAPPIFYFFNHGLWRNMTRKLKNNATVTDNSFAFLIIAQNAWTSYGPQLSGYMNNAGNYVPATTPIPIPPDPIPPIPPSGSNIWFDIRNYGANGSDNLNDDAAIQKAYNAAAAVKGTVYWPRASNKWYLGNSITIIGAFIQVNTYAEGEPGNISWRGGSNKNVFNFIGLNTSNWDGLNIEIPSAYSNVAIFNVDTNLEIRSSSFNTFENMYCNLNAPNCVVFRMGFTQSINGQPTHGDISNWRIKNCVAYGPLNNPQPGTFLVQSLHGNVLANTLEDAFVAYCDGVFSNWSIPGSGRGGCFGTFKAIDTSQNICEFYFDREGAYPIYGGRLESPGKLLKTAPGSHSISVTFTGMRLDAAKGDGVLVEINTPGTYAFYNMTMHRQTNETFTDLITLNGGGGVGTIIIDAGSTRANNLIRKVGGATQWKAYVKGLTRWKQPNPVQTEGWYPDVNGQQL